MAAESKPKSMSEAKSTDDKGKKSLGKFTKKKKKKRISSPIPFLLSPESKHKFLLAVCTKQLIISNLAIS